MWQSIHTSMCFQTSPLETNSDDKQGRQAVTTCISSSQAPFSDVCNYYGNSSKLPTFPANAFALKNWSSLDWNTENNQKLCPFRICLFWISPKLGGRERLLFGKEWDYHLATQLAKKKEKIKKKTLNEAFYNSEVITVMPSLTVLSLKKSSLHLHLLPSC